MRELTNNVAANVMVLMTDNADHITGKTGLTLTITASKDGADFVSITPTVTERGDGWYNLALTTSHTDTLGELALHVTGTDADPADTKMLVIAVNKADTVRMGLTALPNAAAAAANGLLIFGSGTGSINPSGGKVPATLEATDVTGDLSSNLVAILGTAPTEGAAGRLAAAFTKFFDKASPTGTINSLPDAVAGAAGGISIVGSLMGLIDEAITAGKIQDSAFAGAKFATNFLTATKIATDAFTDLEFSAAAIAEIQAGLATSSGLSAAIAALNDLSEAEVRAALGLAAANLDTQLAAIPTASDNADAVRTELTPELALIDVAVSTRLADADYVIPGDATEANQNTIIAAIDAIPTAPEIDTQLSTTHGATSWEGGAGSGLTPDEQQTLADLKNMIDESGTPAPEFTAEALSNAATVPDGILVGGLTEDAMEQLSTSGIHITGNTGPDGYLEIVQGDDYPSLVVAEVRVDQWPDLTTATGYRLGLLIDGETTIIEADDTALDVYPDGRRFLTFEVGADDTAFATMDDNVVNGHVHAVATLPSARRTLIRPTAIARVLRSIIPLA